MSKREALVESRIPSWANIRKINAIYAEAERRRMAGYDVQVDHIIPLTHPLVSGLHCEDNLQIITSRENSYKCNYFSEGIVSQIVTRMELQLAQAELF